MANLHVNLTITTNASNFVEVNEEFSRLKLTIGILLAKLAPTERENFIKDLRAVGLNEEADIYENFNKPKQK